MPNSLPEPRRPGSLSARPATSPAGTDAGNRSAPLVEEYLILDTRRIWARLHRREPLSGKFLEADYRDGDTVHLASIDAIVSLDELSLAARIADRRRRAF